MFAFPQNYTSVVKRLARAGLQDIQILVLCFAVLLYGAFGSPTPDNPGYLEGFIGGLLVLAVGFSGVWKAVRLSSENPLWFSLGQVFLIFGCVVPVIAGLIAGNDVALMVRDFVPFLFMVLPILLFVGVRVKPETASVVMYSVLGAGLLFAVRSVLDLRFLGAGDSLYYLGNAPSVLFAALFFAGSAMTVFIERFNLRSCLLAACLCALAGLCLWPIIEAQQRASFGVFILSMIVLWLVYLWRMPKRALLILFILGCTLFPFIDSFSDVLANFSQKTKLVGANMRVQEWAAVWAEVSDNPLSLVFGSGWGAVFSSPAVADIQVNFTHGLLSSLLLKTGLIGFTLGAAYLAVVFKLPWSVFMWRPFIALALAGPVLIDVFLYASFKSLDFGLMLLLISILHYQNYQNIFSGIFYGEDEDVEIAY